MARSLNKAELIGNLTRDPELRYTPQGTAVCTFGLATNRQWTIESGEKKEDVEFHRIVAWNKLAELCAQLLGKGRKIYVEGRLQTRKWTGQDGFERTTTEVVIRDMIILDSRYSSKEGDLDIPEDLTAKEEVVGDKEGQVKESSGVKKKGSKVVKKTKKATAGAGKKKDKKQSGGNKELDEDIEDIPF